MNQKRLKIKREVGKISEKVLSRVVDLVLTGIYFNFEFAKFARHKRFLIESKVGEDLEIINYEVLKRAFVFLKQKGLIETINEEQTLPTITAAGQKRLSSLLPHYDEKRFWDRKIYLITYDLPVKKNKERKYLRNYLKTLGCGLLQESLWITPYNPKKLLEEFIKKNGLEEDLILISTLGKGGTIGNMTFADLIEKVYRLSEINSKYNQFLAEAKSSPADNNRLIFKYLSILENDPQLPFELLPNNWLGVDAYLKFKELSSTSKSSTPKNL